jgi:acyl dehydratase
MGVKTLPQGRNWLRLPDGLNIEIMQASGTPVHVDEAYVRTAPFGTRVAHGLLGLSLADGLKTQAEYRFLPGISLGWTWDFKLPIKLGDTLHLKFRIGAKRPVKRPGWASSSSPANSSTSAVRWFTPASIG